ncbi:Fis family transcriptional regulator [Sorangium cellulosum]|uniref:Fis family transcriptional regulator n=1 Tax=Sorangium cellulosum TaxID=56 RepID=A0A2L0F1T3_SORCE|nr:sigma 54-interacting transcriptional regulator [Sorangium cellulosum]AUX45496.1 Fis family transcriptional regulator [Sorangium cellulosum]
MTTNRSGRHPPAGAEPPDQRAAAGPPRSPVARELTVFAGDAVVVHPLPASGSVSIGRAADNHIRIDHPSVSRRHAVLHLGPALRIEDLGGTNPISVRASRADPGPTVAEAGKTEDMRQVSRQAIEIAPGDCITLGSALVVVRLAEAAMSGPPAGRDPASAPGEHGEIIVRDLAMIALYEQAYLAAPGLISVLLLGETGTGKEVLARAIHRRSSPARARGPFLGLNCAALSESLLESELFGHEKGAFTGALQARPGLFEAADGGTVFLDEVGELPKATQVKLLRVLEERQVMRVGGRVPRSIDVRFLSATHRDLEAEVAHGAFRQDLYFRLNGVTLTIPPLRERAADIAPLVRLFATKACKAFERRHVPRASAEALALLERYPWPGNIRELRNVIERAVMLCTGDTLLPEHLPPKMRTGAAPPAAAAGAAAAGAAAGVAGREVAGGAPEPAAAAGAGLPGAALPGAALPGEGAPSEKQRIIEALEKCAGNQTYAARLLGISRRTLVSRLAAYDLPRPRKPRERP